MRTKNERLAQIGRDRAQRANRYADTEHDSDGPCPAEYAQAEVGEVVGSAQDADPKVSADKRANQPFANLMRRLFGRKKKQGPVVSADAQKPPDANTVALREEIGQKVAKNGGSTIGTEMKTYLLSKGQGIVGGPQAVDVRQDGGGGSNVTTHIAPLPGTFFPELGTIVSVRFVDETGRERTIPFELTSRQLASNGTTYNPSIPLNYNFFYFHCLSPTRAPPATATDGTRLRSMAKRMIAGLGEGGGRTGRTTGEESAGEAVDGSVPQQRWLHRRRTKSEWRRRDANPGRRRRPMPADKVIERRAPEDLASTITPVTSAPMVVEEVDVHEQEAQQESDEDSECEICSNFYVDEQKLTTTSTTPRAPEHRLDEVLEPKLALDGNAIETEESIEDPEASLVAQRDDRNEASARPNHSGGRNALWRGLSKRLSAFRERHAGKSAHRKPLPETEPPSTRTSTMTNLTDDEAVDSNEIVEYYQQDLGRVLYRMANGRVLEEPQRYHLRRSSDDEADVSPRQRRLNRINKRRKQYKDAPATEDKTPATKPTPIINIGSFGMPNGAASVSNMENTGASRTMGGPEMDNYIMQKVREYCSTSCGSGKVVPPPVIIVPEKPSYAIAYPPDAVAAPAATGEQIVGSQLIVQPAGTYSQNEAPTTRSPSDPGTTPRSCPTKIVKCIPRAMASKSKQTRKAGTTSNDEEKDTVAGPLVAAFRQSTVA